MRHLLERLVSMLSVTALIAACAVLLLALAVAVHLREAERAAPGCSTVVELRDLVRLNGVFTTRCEKARGSDLAP